MKRYRVLITSHELFIIAKDEEEAEAKYDAYWSNSCTCGASGCSCVEENDYITHETTEDDSFDCCSLCGETTEVTGGEYEFASPTHPYFTCKDCLEIETVSCGACGLLVLDVEEHWSDCDENPNSDPDLHFVAPKESN